MCAFETAAIPHARGLFYIMEPYGIIFCIDISKPREAFREKTTANYYSNCETFPRQSVLLSRKRVF